MIKLLVVTAMGQRSNHNKEPSYSHMETGCFGSAKMKISVVETSILATQETRKTVRELEMGSLRKTWNVRERLPENK